MTKTELLIVLIVALLGNIRVAGSQQVRPRRDATKKRTKPPMKRVKRCYNIAKLFRDLTSLKEEIKTRKRERQQELQDNQTK